MKYRKILTLKYSISVIKVSLFKKVYVEYDCGSFYINSRYSNIIKFIFAFNKYIVYERIICLFSFSSLIYSFIIN